MHFNSMTNFNKVSYIGTSIPKIPWSPTKEFDAAVAAATTIAVASATTTTKLNFKHILTTRYRQRCPNARWRRFVDWFARHIRALHNKRRSNVTKEDTLAQLSSERAHHRRHPVYKLSEIYDAPLPHSFSLSSFSLFLPNICSSTPTRRPIARSLARSRAYHPRREEIALRAHVPIIYPFSSPG